MFKKYQIILLFLLLLVMILYLDHDEQSFLSFLNIGQGDSIFVKNKNASFLIDTGPNDSLFSNLDAVSKDYHDYIDALIITHSDSDHSAQAGEVVDKLKPQIVFLNALPLNNKNKPPKTIINLLTKSVENKIPVVLIKRGLKISFGQSFFDVLFPDRNVDNLERNTGSLTMHLKNPKFSAFLSGDLPSSVENYLVDLGLQKATIVKAGHHGSKTSTSQKLLSALDPEIAVISAGTKNNYGHPTKEVLDRLLNSKIKVFSTGESGNLVFRF